jgi:hypothetical protein
MGERTLVHNQYISLGEYNWQQPACQEKNRIVPLDIGNIVIEVHTGQ